MQVTILTISVANWEFWQFLLLLLLHSIEFCFRSLCCYVWTLKNASHDFPDFRCLSTVWTITITFLSCSTAWGRRTTPTCSSPSTGSRTFSPKEAQRKSYPSFPSSLFQSRVRQLFIVLRMIWFVSNNDVFNASVILSSIMLSILLDLKVLNYLRIKWFSLNSSPVTI